jgi:hypothetical protein
VCYHAQLGFSDVHEISYWDAVGSRVKYPQLPTHSRIFNQALSVDLCTHMSNSLFQIVTRMSDTSCKLFPSQMEILIIFITPSMCHPSIPISQSVKTALLLSFSYNPS